MPIHHYCNTVHFTADHWKKFECYFYFKSLLYFDAILICWLQVHNFLWLLWIFYLSCWLLWWEAGCILWSYISKISVRSGWNPTSSVRGISTFLLKIFICCCFIVWSPYLLMNISISVQSVFFSDYWSCIKSIKWTCDVSMTTYGVDAVVFSFSAFGL